MTSAHLILAAAPLLLLIGCGTSEETAQTPPPNPPAPTVQQAQPKPDFETRTDTVAARRKATDTSVPASHRDLQIRYMVQIGAFKDPANASAVQTAARQRYHMPVVNDYHTKLSLYQIRIGFFETRGAAETFRERMKREFPKDYTDSWVVQLKR